ncbi:MAG TPA: hypothetical protein VE053_06665 [Allosphingosinicella sp.]|nr:hypothetical protein [Allosphingosinicella sp.]
MSNMLICQPLPISSVAAAIPAFSTGVSNLLTPDPKEIWTGTVGSGTLELNIDMGATVTVDTIFVGGMNGSFLSAFRGGTGMGTGMVDLYAPGAPTNAAPYGFSRLAASAVKRYFQISISNLSTHPSAGVVLFGLSFQPTHNREWGGGRQLIDTGAKESLLGGGFGIGQGARKAAYRWTFGDLTDAEVEALWTVAKDRGETSPVLVVEDPADTANLGARIHYGLFEKFEAFERQNPSQTRWALSMTEWT